MPSMTGSAAARFVEIADRVFVARYAEWDVNVGLVVGADGVLAVDSRASERQGQEALDDVRAVAPHSPVRWLVNTHAHFDHVLGNQSFTAATVWTTTSRKRRSEPSTLRRATAYWCRAASILRSRSSGCENATWNPDSSVGS